MTLPVALLAFEWFLGERKFKRLIPYFLISLNFGLQALWHNYNVSSVSGYALRFTPNMLWTTVDFYASAIFFVPLAGFALLLLPFFVRDRRLYVGLIFMVSLFVPMFVLPGRLERVYWYIPMIGLAIAVAAIALRVPRWSIVLFFVLWLPVNYVVLREKRRALLATGDEHRWYTMGLFEYARHVPKLKAVVFQSTPRFMGAWGIEGAIHHAFGHDVYVAWYLDAAKAPQAMAEVPMAIVGYHPSDRTVRGLLRTRDEPGSYIRFAEEFPIYQFGEGWEHEWGLQSRIAKQAEITMFRPPEAKEFEIVAGGPAKITVLEDERSLGTQTLAGPGVEPLRWPLPSGTSASKKVTIRSEHHGVAIRAIGYVTP